MRFKSLVIAVFASALTSVAHAQTLPSIAVPLTGGNTALISAQGITCSGNGPAAVGSTVSALAAAGCPSSGFTTTAWVNLNQFASQGDLSALAGQAATHGSQIATANSQISALNGQVTLVNSQIATANSQISALNGQVTLVNSQIAALNQRLSDSNGFVAAVGAMHDAIPDPGDRFAVRLNSAAVNGVVAGGVSASANLGDGFRASINYAGARGQNAVSAGLNFSFK